MDHLLQDFFPFDGPDVWADEAFEWAIQGFVRDSDGDGYGAENSVPVEACAAPVGTSGNLHVSNDDDCDDVDITVYLGAPEVCDGLDNDCDGIIDEEAGQVDDPLNCGDCGVQCNDARHLTACFLNPAYQFAFMIRLAKIDR